MKSANVNLVPDFGRMLLFATVVLCTAASSVGADSNTAEYTKLVCEPTLDWQTLSTALQARIDGLETEGIENLSDDMFEHYAKLADSLLTVKKLQTRHYDVLIAAEKRKQVEQEKVMAAERAETADIEKTDQKIKELEDALLDWPRVSKITAGLIFCLFFCQKQFLR